jgi:methylenetetrahydrofolate--tRNA-(uracil-5-)-methyltransferase
LRARPTVFCAGQITGVEGYVESAGSGHIAARRALARLRGEHFEPPPPTSALGALLRHVSGEAHPEGYEYQPSNIVFALFPPLSEPHRKQERKSRLLARARRDLAAWARSHSIPLRPEPPPRRAAPAPSPPTATLERESDIGRRTEVPR